MVNHHPAKFGDHRHFGNVDIIFSNEDMIYDICI